MFDLYYNEKFAHLCNCLCIATADGNLCPASIDILFWIINRIGLKEFDFEKACRLLKNKTLRYTIWEDYIIKEIGKGGKFDSFVEDLLKTAHLSEGKLSVKMELIYNIMQKMASREIVLVRKIQELINDGFIQDTKQLK